MEISYYKHDDLKYSNRKRFRVFNYVPFNTERSNKMLFNDDGYTTIKTSKDNICDYVSIDGTRWFYIYHTYLNGGQVALHLQRDVAGEFGLSNVIGKIERGYTDSFLRNRKELSLNEILKDRKKLIPSTYEYGNYGVNNHDREMWGILYFTKPTGLNPITGEPYPEQININIPAFAPEVLNYPIIDSGSKKYVSHVYNIKRTAFFRFEYERGVNYIVRAEISFNVTGNGDSREVGVLLNKSRITYPSANDCRRFYINNLSVPSSVSIEYARNSIEDNLIKTWAFWSIGGSGRLPNENQYDTFLYDYNNATLKDNSGNFYQYTGIDSVDYSYGTNDFNSADNYMNSLIGSTISGDNDYRFSANLGSYIIGGSAYLTSTNELEYRVVVYERRLLSPSESGNIVISTTEQLIDEPYSVLVFPLFDVNISGLGNYSIDKSDAFMIFNTVIQYLSGDNPYIVDAQIYPYCPVLTSVATELSGYPFFKISSNTYNHECYINLLPDIDIKKEYIKRRYRLISPEQSGLFDFNFYDYCNRIEEQNGVNIIQLRVTIKTALKPFAIISSAVINPDIDSLMGITYGSDLRGSNSSSNGFECSLSSNLFEQYKRQNSNYQQIFRLQQDELAKNHEVERVNDIVSGIVNTVTATSMGAIAGASLTDYSFLGTKMAGVGAAVGATAAGGAVGGMMDWQNKTNEDIRTFEKELQLSSFNLTIGTIKALPNSINRISSFNEIILQDFWYIIETYECSEYEKGIVDNFIDLYGYGIGVFGNIIDYVKNGWFIRSTVLKSNLISIHQSILSEELKGGIYYYE